MGANGQELAAFCDDKLALTISGGTFGEQLGQDAKPQVQELALRHHRYVEHRRLTLWIRIWS